MPASTARTRLVLTPPASDMLAGKSVQVLRSIRHAPKRLALRGPVVKTAKSSYDMDILCDLWSRLAVTTASPRSPIAFGANTNLSRFVLPTKQDGEAESRKDDTGKRSRTRAANGAAAPVRRSRRLSNVKSAKGAAATPVRRSSRLSSGTRTNLKRWSPY